MSVTFILVIFMPMKCIGFRRHHCVLEGSPTPLSSHITIQSTLLLQLPHPCLGLTVASMKTMVL